jgi:uracil-DNA glycosylase
MHAIRLLLKKMSVVEPYPAGVKKVPELITGTAFFPGGRGLWNPQSAKRLPEFPVGGVMVLGHDFHSEAAYRKSLLAGTEVNGNPTWRNLLPVLDEAGISREECFYTNAYMGLRKGVSTMGKFPGSKDRGFVDRCREFLNVQIQVQRPKLILTLGSWVPAFIAATSNDLSHWGKAKSFALIDAESPMVLNAQFSEAGHTAHVIALTHPCLRNSNVGRRRFGRFRGHRAEMKMLEKVL